MKKGKYNEKYYGNLDPDYVAETRVLCKCGHSVSFVTKVPYIECTHCHRIIFRNKKSEYDFRIKRRLGVYE